MTTMMPRLKMKNRLAAIVLLALTASTALRFHSWLQHGLETTTTTTTITAVVVDPSYYPADFNRRLTHETLQERVHRGVRARGHTPGSRKFNRVMKIMMDRRRRALVNMRRINEERKMTEQKNNHQEERKLVKHMSKEDMDDERRMEEEVIQTLKESKKNMTWVRGPYYSTLRGQVESNSWNRATEVKEAKQLDEVAESFKEAQQQETDYEPLTVCGRPADVGSTEDFASLQKYAQCPEITKEKPILILEGNRGHGRTGNNLIEFLHAIQETRDEGIQLGVMAFSWATNLLSKMWMAIDSDDWVTEFEKAFCVKIFHAPADLEGWDVIHKETKRLFYYQSQLHLGEYMDSQEYQIRTLFRNYNTGEGKDRTGRPVQDMCSGIDAIFGESRESAIYSVIHSRTLEGEPGFRLLAHNARKSGCDPVAALEMRPDYVKSILEPLGMMKYPIVFITDGQNSEVLDRLQADPEIGPLIHSVPEEACWIGGDLTLAVMSNVFIGNPASTFTGFIAKSRLALGFGHNYLFRAKDENGEWKTVCGDHCVFDRSIMGVQA